jgi:small-conductance mechanosensitive channel
VTPGPVGLAGLPYWAERLVWTGVAIVVALAVTRLLRHLVRRWAREPVDETGDLVRLRRRETAAAMVIAASRYVVFAVAAFAIIGIFARSPVTALGGASLIVVLVGFALQRFLMDVVAGTLALVEDQYGVGDFIRVEPSDLAGIVEEFGLRTTVLRGLNGDRYVIPNSQITAVQRSERGYRAYNLELLTSDPDLVEREVNAVAALAPDGDARFLRPPRVVERRELGDQLWLVRVQAEVAPTLEWLAEQFLAQTLERRVGHSLATSPIVYTLDSNALRRYEARLLVR